MPLDHIPIESASYLEGKLWYYSIPSYQGGALVKSKEKIRIVPMQYGCV
jgi:hypothetical protein